MINIIFKDMIFFILCISIIKYILKADVKEVNFLKWIGMENINKFDFSIVFLL